MPKQRSNLPLKLTQTRSFIDFLEMKIAEEKARWEEKARDLRSQEESGKLRASNINATSLQIGSWKVNRY